MVGTSGIYKISCSTTGKFYIGSSINIPRRFKQHISSLINKTHDNRYLQSAWDKYGEASFVLSILFYYEPSELIFIEQRCIDILKPDFNICVKVVNSHLGVQRSDITKQRLRESKLGKTLSIEHRESIRKATLGNTSALGYKYTPEQKKAASLSRIGNTNAKGHKLSAEARDKISKGNKGRNITDAHKAIISASNRGRKHTDEAKLKISTAKLGSTRTPEQRAKLGRKVIDLFSNIVYASIPEAAQSIGIKTHTLYAMLRGFNKNKTTMVFV